MTYVLSALEDLDYEVELQYFSVPFAEYVTQPGISGTNKLSLSSVLRPTHTPSPQPNEAAFSELLRYRLRWSQSNHGQRDTDKDCVCRYCSFGTHSFPAANLGCDAADFVGILDGT